jgi:hypothetical protein
MTKRITQKTFGELDVGEHFWRFSDDVGSPVLERTKTGPDSSAWSDGTPFPELINPNPKSEVWTVEYCGWWDYLWRICTVILVLLTIAFITYFFTRK